MKYYDFSITTESVFTIKAKSRRDAQRIAAKVFGGGEIVESIVTGLAHPITVETFRHLPHGSCDASEPELTETRPV